MQRKLNPSYTIGPDAYEDIVNICPRYGKKVAIIGGKKALAAAEEQIVAQSKAAGLDVIGVFWYGGEASVENIERLTPLVAEADMLFAVGGGKAIDTCKVLSQHTDRPFFTFPTIASTCASYTSLGILYHPDGSLREYSYSKVPSTHVFINTQIISEAPVRYLWAGMGDTMAKYFESSTSSRGHILDHSDGMGVCIAPMCVEPIVRCGKNAMADCEAHNVSHDLSEVILSIIVATGTASNYLQIDYTAGMAHAMYNGFTVLPSTEEHGHLHGEVVAYGNLVLLTANKDYEKRAEILAFNKSIGLPTKLSDMHATVDDLPTITAKAISGMDMNVWPYPVSQQMLIDAALELENLE